MSESSRVRSHTVERSLRVVIVIAGLALAIIIGALYGSYYIDLADGELARRVAAEEAARAHSREMDRALARAESSQRLAEQQWVEAVAALASLQKERDRLLDELERLRRENERLRGR